jgi:peptide chain release factor 1
MKDFLRKQLIKFEERLLDLESLLSSPDIMADQTAYRKLSKEHAEVTPAAGRYQRYLQRERDLQAARDMASDFADDAEMSAMAQDEIGSAEIEMTALEAELQRRVGAVCGRLVAHVHALL